MKIKKLRPTFGIAPWPEPLPVAVKSLGLQLDFETSSLPAPVTEVAARIDVGPGNTVFIRGQGASLSWDQGVPLKCVSAARWVYSSSQVREKLVFKLLLNDEVWARGEDIVLDAGKQIELAPVF